MFLYEGCLEYPWIGERLMIGLLGVVRCFVDCYGHELKRMNKGKPGRSFKLTIPFVLCFCL